MRKNEYLHLHALFGELRRYLEETGHALSQTFTAYDNCGVTPTEIYRRKDQHRKALDCLRHGVRLTIEASDWTGADTTED